VSDLKLHKAHCDHTSMIYTEEAGRCLRDGELKSLFDEQQQQIEQLREEAQINRDLIAEIDHQQLEIERLRAFAYRVYLSEDSPAWSHDAAAKLLDLPSLAHGCDDTVEEVDGE
jgi:hypothetical protein